MFHVSSNHHIKNTICYVVAWSQQDLATLSATLQNACGTETSSADYNYPNDDL